MVWQFLKTLNTELLYDPEIPLLYKPKRVESSLGGIFNTHVHSSIIHNSQKVESTLESTNRLINKQNVVSAYYEILKSRSVSCSVGSDSLQPHGL